MGMHLKVWGNLYGNLWFPNTPLNIFVRVLLWESNYYFTTASGRMSIAHPLFGNRLNETHGRTLGTLYRKFAPPMPHKPTMYSCQNPAGNESRLYIDSPGFSCHSVASSLGFSSLAFCRLYFFCFSILISLFYITVPHLIFHLFFIHVGSDALLSTCKCYFEKGKSELTTVLINIHTQERQLLFMEDNVLLSPHHCPQTALYDDNKGWLPAKRERERYRTAGSMFFNFLPWKWLWVFIHFLH